MWRMQCKRRVDHVYIVFICGCESCSWSQQALNSIKGLETHMTSILFYFRRNGDETWVE